jgi:cellulose synthase/poly-beta-1,6-N-acetylglucosamine synthase-like glycosyltransferase
LNSHSSPLPVTEIVATVISLVMTVAATFLAALGYFSIIPAGRPELVIQSVIILLLLSALLLGNLVYQISRLGSIFRLRSIMPVSRKTLEDIYDNPNAPSLCVLIPSYKEEICVLKQTVLSASLSEYPNRRVVVLIDDPPEGSKEDLRSINLTRAMISETNALFLAQKEHILELIPSVSSFLSGEGRFDCSSDDKGGSIRSLPDERKACRRLSELFLDAAGWIERIGAEFHSRQNYCEHTDHLFLKKVVSAPADDLRRHAFMLKDKGEPLRLILRDLSRLGTMFDVNISSFERKKYVNLSHQANKAMNLNSYISLIGSSFREESSYDGKFELLNCKPEYANFHVPPADYLLTLDADSFITHDYILKLSYILGENPRVAVAQTPYSAIPSAPGVLERTAGATTDVQYLQHQGYTYWNATFWVGANAILRYSALRDIRQITEERGFSISVYIQDKTVIEDTGSTIDLVNKDWILFNYPDRLSYSATPRDFGSLIIQRRRWSNGGLILYPSMLQYARKKTIRLSLMEFLVRTQYLLSPTLTNGALMFLFLLPFNRLLLTNPFVLLVAIPYYYIYGRDLRLSGYRWVDLFRVYSLNLLLMPVNMAGVLMSIRQLITGEKAPFGRTPKIEGRTRMSGTQVLIQWSVFSYLLFFSVTDIISGRYMHALFCLFNLIFYLYGLTAFIPWNESWDDLRYSLAKRKLLR